MFLHERFTHKCLLIKRSLIGSRTDSFRKRSTSFSVVLPRTICAYLVCVLNVLYTVSVLILHRESFSTSAITPCHVLIGQTSRMRDGDSTAICDRTKMKKEAGISTRAFPLESLSNYQRCECGTCQPTPKTHESVCCTEIG